MGEKLTVLEAKSRAGSGPGTWAVHVQAREVLDRTTRDGNPYLEVAMADAEGDFVLRVWGDHPDFETVKRWAPGTFLEMVGEWSGGKFGLEVKNWRARPLELAETEELLGGSPGRRAGQDADYAYIGRVLAEIADPRLRELAGRFLDEFGVRFRRTAAARGYHHARRGGLVEHVAQMMRAACALAEVYPSLNRDLLVSGILFHDCGKLWENCYAKDGFTMPHTLVGELLGHIPMGIELVNRLWADLLGEPDRAAAWAAADPPSDLVRLHLLHLIGAHHGEHAFGSPVLPKTPEAAALHYIDNLDAKLEMFAAGYATSPQLAPGIHERVRPLPGNLVAPLPPPGPTPDGAGAGAPQEKAPSEDAGPAGEAGEPPQPQTAS